MNDKRVWFITGAGSGIGAGIAKAALRAGDRVVASGAYGLPDNTQIKVEDQKGQNHKGSGGAEK
jgi:NAD(P)-dependent dehydrogenase (short-subunit alcohol dehydrogenase family)